MACAGHRESNHSGRWPYVTIRQTSQAVVLSAPAGGTGRPNADCPSDFVWSNMTAAGSRGVSGYVDCAVADVPGRRPKPVTLGTAEMVGHLPAQGRLDHRLGQLLHQPVWAGQRQSPCSVAVRTRSAAACFSANASTGFSLAISSIVSVVAPYPSSSSDPLSVSGNEYRYVDSFRIENPMTILSG